MPSCFLRADLINGRRSAWSERRHQLERFQREGKEEDVLIKASALPHRDVNMFPDDAG
jgi:hypothetical protein